MISVSDGISPFQFSTRGLPLRECDKSLRALYDRKSIFLKLEPVRGSAFHADISRMVLPELGIMSGTMGGLRHLGPAQGDDLFLFMNLSGESVASDGSNEVALHGRAICGRPATIHESLSHPNRVRFIALRFPGRAVAPLIPSADNISMQLVPSDTGALRLLAAYVGTALKDARALEAPDSRRLFATHVHDLVALALGATRDGAFVAEGRGVRAARLRAIKDDIAANLDADLTVTATAVRHSVTPRYIHKLFEAEGTTYSQYVAVQRLARVHRMLTDPRFISCSISSLAYGVGFGDLSHFNRLFRLHYHATPSDVRYQRA